MGSSKGKSWVEMRAEAGDEQRTFEGLSLHVLADVQAANGLEEGARGHHAFAMHSEYLSGSPPRFTVGAKYLNHLNKPFCTFELHDRTIEVFGSAMEKVSYEIVWDYKKRRWATSLDGRLRPLWEVSERVLGPFFLEWPKPE